MQQDTFLCCKPQQLFYKNSFIFHTYILFWTCVPLYNYLGCCNRMMSSAFTNCCFFFLQLDRLKQCLPAPFFFVLFYRQMITTATITSSFVDAVLKVGLMLAEAVKNKRFKMF